MSKFKLHLSPGDEDALTQLVRRRTGIVLQPYQLDSLAEVAHGACAQFGYGSVGDYVAALDRSNVVSPELEYLVGHITVGESYFFRDDEQLRFLREGWLPEVIDRKYHGGDRTLRIWSAGCSAGQEIYTLAMVLLEQLPEPETWNLHLLGTDINTAALGQAIRGQYTNWSLRATGATLRARYFEQVGTHYRLKPPVRELVKFSYLNLLEDSFPSMLSGTAAMDLILCRNVFIYFDPKVIPLVMQKFHASLVPGGYLMLGASDLVAEPTDDLELYHWGNTFCFRRNADHASFALPTRQPFPAPVVPPAMPNPPPLQPVPEPVVRAAEPAAAAAPAEGVRGRSPYVDVIACLRDERWQAALEAANRHIEREGNNADLAQFRAKALANLGLMEEAAQASDASIVMAPLDKHTYLIKALIMVELNNTPKAMEALRKAIFLDATFVEAHFQLGLLQLRQGERKAGIRSLSNALELAERLDPERQVHNAPGLVFGRLAEILRRELNVYQEE